MPNFFAPLTAALGSVLAATHSLVTALGLSGPLGWVVAIALLTCVVRIALLPFAVAAARNTRRAAQAAPALRALQTKYADRSDRDSLRALVQERRAITREHGMSPLGYAPLLVQMPVFIALYHLVTNLSGGTGAGALTAATVASASIATIGGVHLGTRLVGASATQTAIMLTLALGAGLASFATSRYFTVNSGAEQGQLLHMVMPWVGLLGVLVGSFFVPAGMVLYWTFNNVWTLGQQAWLTRRFVG